MAPDSSTPAWKIPWTEEPGAPMVVTLTELYISAFITYCVFEIITHRAASLFLTAA